MRRAEMTRRAPARSTRSRRRRRLQTEQNLGLMRRIDEQFLETPFFGVRQMTWHLRNDGHLVNEKRIYEDGNEGARLSFAAAQMCAIDAHDKPAGGQT